MVAELSAPILLSGDAIIDLDGTIFVQLAIFFALFVVLHRLVFRPLLTVLDARSVAIEGAREEAHGLEASIAQSEAQYRAELEKLKQAAGVEEDRLRQEGAQLERSLIENVRKETHGNLEESRQRLEREGKTLRAELSAQVPKLAAEVSARVLGRGVKNA